MSARTILIMATVLPIAACGHNNNDSGAVTSATVCIDEDLGSAVGQPVAKGTTSGDDYQAGICGKSTVGTDGADWGYTWTAPATAGYTISTAGSSFNTVLVVLKGDCNGEVLACNDDLDPDIVDSQVYVKLTEGQKVVIVVDGYDAYEGGAFTLQILQDI